MTATPSSGSGLRLRIPQTMRLGRALRLVKEAGTDEELMLLAATYANLFEAQAAMYRPGGRTEAHAVA
jgi:hypothetical protein